MKKQKLKKANINIKNMFDNKFEILDCIKKSEYGAVYLARQLSDNKKVVVKTLKKSLVGDDENERRFYREAKILSGLESTNIIKLIECGEDDGHLFITFEYFESSNFRYYFSEAEISVEQKKDLLIQLCLGLKYLHANGIIHRDLKPENILVNDKLKLKISDFGLALSLNDDFTTQINSIVGTPCYMSPEQIQGKPLTYQSDLFSLGTIVFELFSNENIFLSTDFNSTINKILNTSWSDIESKTAEFPEEINSILELLLQKECALRAGSINEILDILFSGSSSFPKRKHKPSFEIKYLLYVVPILVILFLLYFFQGNEAEPEFVNINPPHAIKDTVKVDSSEIELSLVDSVLISEIPDESQRFISPANIAKNESAGNRTEEIIEEKISPGWLFVDSYPWSNISIDGKSFGATPFERSVELSPGIHELQISHPDFPAISKSINIIPDSTIKLIFNIENEFGYLNCTVFPWADVYLNEKLLGQTPFEKPFPLLPGSYLIKIANPGFTGVEKEVSIAAADTHFFNYSFTESALN